MSTTTSSAAASAARPEIPPTEWDESQLVSDPKLPPTAVAPEPLGHPRWTVGKIILWIAIGLIGALG